MNPEEFKQALSDKGIILSSKQMAQFKRYFELLVEWNDKINLTAITEEKDVYLKHFYDSISVSFYEKFDQDALQICDVGAGAGFPSLPLKIVFPQLQVTIVDSLNKRIQFLDLLAKELDLTGVQFFHSRAEDFGQNQQFRASFDIVTARAVAKMSVLSELCLPLVKKNGKFIALKASNSQVELKDAKKAIAVLGGQLIADEVFQLSETAGERHIIVIQKKKETPNKYPRKAGLPNKKPL